MSMVFGPINTLLSIVPTMGRVSKSIFGFITFIIALILSAVTILISMIIHNVIALIVTVVVILAIIIYFIRKKSDKTQVVQNDKEKTEEPIVNNIEKKESIPVENLDMSNEEIQKNEQKEKNKKD